MKTVLFPHLSQQTNLVIAISIREEGSMKLVSTSSETKENRERFLKRYGIEIQNMVSASMVHGKKVALVTSEDIGKPIAQTDALITSDRNVYLSVTAADCLPIFIYDPAKLVIGLIHAGWRGLEKQVIQETITSLIQNFDCDPHSLLIGIGPGIGICHFAVTKDVLDVFQEYTNAIEQREGAYFLDLKKIATEQLVKAGCLISNIETSALCTYCEKEMYFSYRRDHATPMQVMMCVIGMI